MSQADTDYVTALVKKSGTSFYHGMKILPEARRDAMYAIYAFCRVVDDIADEETRDFATKKRELDKWRGKIARLYQDGTDDPITRALLGPVRAYGLRQEDFLAVIDGMEMDAGAPIIAPTLQELDLYCDRVASAVGRLSVCAFGDTSPAAQNVAYHLGRGLQLTNILRDVGEDAENGRIYLPRELLVAGGVDIDPKTLTTSPNLPEICRKLSKLAEDHFTQAEAAMAQCNQAAMRPARLMKASYQPLLRILNKRQFDYRLPRATLPKWQKLAMGLKIIFSRK